MSDPAMGIPEDAARRRDEQAQIELANKLLASHRYGTPEHERGFELLQRATEGPLGPYAQWLLGAYHIQVSSRPNAHVAAAQWLQRAAAAGISPAIDRLADLYLLGLGVAHSAEQAVSLQRHLADRGHAHATWQVGYLESQNGPSGPRHDPAATAFLRACALAYPPAYYSLGLRFALGAGIGQDRAFGRALLLRAADGGFLGARAAADELVPDRDLANAASDWHLRLKRNLDDAQALRGRLMPDDAPLGQSVNEIVLRLEAHLVSVGHPAFELGSAGRACVQGDGSEPLRAQPEAWEWLSTGPRVGVVRGFATREECAHLMNKVAPSLSEPHQYRTGRSANDDAELESFSGRGHPFGAMHTDAVVRVLENRIAAKTDWSVASMEPSSVICYRPGEEYRPHVDFFSDEQIEINRTQRGDPGGQRIATFLLYLKQPGGGGETEYPASNLVVRGEPGMAVLHYNVLPDGTQDLSSTHIGRPVEAGEKWLWRSALRANPLYS